MGENAPRVVTRAGSDGVEGGARYFSPGARAVAQAFPDNLYYYEAFIGQHEIAVAHGDSVYWLDDDCQSAHVARGPRRLSSRHLATVVRGYLSEDRSTTFRQRAALPYINGCAAKQLFAPERPGDPSWQLLDIPPRSTEQAHHTHSTARIVYLLRGHGRSVVGMDGRDVEELLPGMVAIFEPMCPHHFESADEPLICLPLHVFSSTEGERAHPMFQGTHLVGR